MTSKGDSRFPGPPESEGEKRPTTEDRDDATSAVSDDLELSDEEDSNESTKEAGEGTRQKMMTSLLPDQAFYCLLQERQLARDPCSNFLINQIAFPSINK